MASECAAVCPGSLQQCLSRHRPRVLRKTRALEYDFEVAPTADPSQVALRFEGAENLTIGPEGELILSKDGSGFAFQTPELYQTIGNERRPVEGHFVIRNKQEVGFEIGAYDHSRTLVIDPVLVFSTYLGLNNAESSARIAVDSSSNMYIAVSSTSTDAASTGAYQANPNGAGDVLITKIDSGGIQAFQTYLGGTAVDTVAGIAVDSGFNIVVAGTTNSSDFPTLNGAQSGPAAAGTQHAFMTVLNPTGTAPLVYSTYIRGTGTDIARGLAVDVKNKAYIIGTTTSTDLPTTDEAFQKSSLSTNQFFVAEVDPLLTATASIPYLTYFGGGNPNNGTVTGGGIAVDANGNVYITGGTNFANTGTGSGTDFPILNAFENCLNGPTKPTTCPVGSTQTDAFVAKLIHSRHRDQLQYSTYVGGTGDDIGNGISLDSSANAYITGDTIRSILLPRVRTRFRARLQPAPTHFWRS